YSLLATHYSLIHVAAVAFGGLEGVDVGGGVLDGIAAVFGHDVVQGLIHVLGHALGVAADVEVPAGFEPRPEFGAGLAHAVLHVELVGLVAGKGGVDAGEQAGFLPGADLVLIKVVGGGVLVAEEQPVAAGGGGGGAFFEEGAERRDAGARPDHDHRGRRIGR